MLGLYKTDDRRSFSPQSRAHAEEATDDRERSGNGSDCRNGPTNSGFGAANNEAYEAYGSAKKAAHSLLRTEKSIEKACARDAIVSSLLEKLRHRV